MNEAKIQGAQRVPESSWVLFHYWRSSCSWRLRWALAHKGIAHVKTHVNLLANEQRGPEFLQLNPSGFVPALKTGEEVWSESLAILEWLEEKFPAPPLLPASESGRLLARQLAHLVATGIQPLQNLLPQQKHSDDPEERKRFARFWNERGLGIYEEMLRRRPTALNGRRSVGNEVTLADLCLIPQVYNAKRYDVDMGRFPLAQAIYEDCLKNEAACQASSPEAQPESRK